MKFKHKRFAVPSILLILMLLCVFAGRYLEVWALEILISQTPQIIVMSILVTAIGWLVFAKKHTKPADVRNWLIAVSAVVVLSLASSLTVQLPSRQYDTTLQTIKFATYNKLFTNPDIVGASLYFKQQNVDIIALQEIRADEVRDMSTALGFKYSYKTDVPHAGVGLISRFPLSDTRFLTIGERQFIRSIVTLPDNQKMAVYSVHIYPPFTPQRYNDSRHETREVISQINKEIYPVIIGGDFNTTIFSPKLREFNQQTKSELKNTTQKPWPPCSWFGYGSGLCMRIDHIYIPEQATLNTLSISPDLGSDHRAVIAGFSSR